MNRRIHIKLCFLLDNVQGACSFASAKMDQQIQAPVAHLINGTVLSDGESGDFEACGKAATSDTFRVAKAIVASQAKPNLQCNQVYCPPSVERATRYP